MSDQIYWFTLKPTPSFKWEEKIYNNNNNKFKRKRKTWYSFVVDVKRARAINAQILLSEPADWGPMWDWPKFTCK